MLRTRISRASDLRTVDAKSPDRRFRPDRWWRPPIFVRMLNFQRVTAGRWHFRLAATV
jgi:hypothetical protein